MRIITFNANGIRSAARKDFFDWFAGQDADVLCVQETKAQYEQLADQEVFFPHGYHHYFVDAEKKGYSGVAVYTRHDPDKVVRGLGWPDIDREGRYLQIDLGKLSIVSLYMPSGTSGEERLAFKLDFMDRLKPLLRSYRRKRREFIICADWNIAHKPIDLKNWRSNQKNSGFLPEERAWLDWLFDECGFVDSFRVVCDEPEQYTWWSNRGRAREKNVGWRLDYQVITPALVERVAAATIHTADRFSDHAPLTMDYDIDVR
ncbi:MAG: exodeoxyribonuclease III [Gammaproteobacteria bacterium]|nr:exodeoxyribonuclease III [Gammaproteobacteria bacterium]